MAKNEEDRMALKPDNIKNIGEWKKFVDEKTGSKFKIVKKIPHKTKCKLLDWRESNEPVAERLFSSNDLETLVHHVLIGPNAMRVWIDIAKVPIAFFVEACIRNGLC